MVGHVLESGSGGQGYASWVPRKHIPLNQTLCHISKSDFFVLVSTCAIDINNIMVTATTLRSNMH